MSAAAKRAALDARVLAAYELHDHDDISTERLLQMVADDCGCDVGRVTDALYREHQRTEQRA